MEISIKVIYDEEQGKEWYWVGTYEDLPRIMNKYTTLLKQHIIYSIIITPC